MRRTAITLSLLPFLWHCAPAPKAPAMKQQRGSQTGDPSNPKSDTKKPGNNGPAGNGGSSMDPGMAGDPNQDMACLAGELTPDPKSAPAMGSVVKTTAAGRVRLRHEKEARYALFATSYWNKRSFGFEVEDYTLKNEGKLVITFKPKGKHVASGNNFPNLRMFDTGDGNVFSINVMMTEQPSANEFRYTITDGRLQAGKVIEFEFGIFLERSDVGEKGDTNYYTDTFRIELGKPGLVAGVPGSPGKKVDPLALAGGWNTVSALQIEDERYLSVSQNALNVQPDDMQLFLEGRSLFHTDFTTGNHTEQGQSFEGDQVNRQKSLAGPTMDTTACAECHNNNGRTKSGSELQQILKIGVKAGEGFGPHPQYGLQLQMSERKSLGQKLVKEAETKKETLADGTVVTLKKDKYTINGEEAVVSPRIPAQIYGLGLLEALSEKNILARTNCDSGKGVTGKAVYNKNPETGKMELGRFGWKAGKTSLKHQVSEALLFDMGVTNPLMPNEACEKTGTCASGTGEVDAELVKRITGYTQLVAVPAVRNLENPQFARGQTLFTKTGCASCHVPKQVTADTHPLTELRSQVIYPYTDLLVHDMGEGLSDGKGEGQAGASEWRTPPLWGLGLMKTVNGQLSLLHDGRAQSYEEAILWHGGEAAGMSAAFKQMSKTDRDDLIFFLNSI